MTNPNKRRATEHAFRVHLESLLPLRNPSGAGMHAVCHYAHEQLSRMGRKPVVDNAYNILAYADGARGIVAHTDSVGQKGGKDLESFTYSGGIYQSARNKRPIGGDDKVGLAIALALAEEFSDLSVILPADEEIGCVGSSSLELPHHALLVQCDRRGASDMVTAIYGAEMTSRDFDWYAAELLPHRNLVDGMMTDVEFLHHYADNSVNLSCGYYSPHTCHESIVWGHALQTLWDARTLFTALPEGIKPHASLSDDWNFDAGSDEETEDDAYWRDYRQFKISIEGEDPFDFTDDDNMPVYATGKKGWRSNRL